MPHNYQVDSVTVTPAKDSVLLIGSVDGIPVEISFWFSAVQGMTPAQKRAFIAPLMLAAALGPPTVDGGAGITGGFVA